jgi:hypothetical protein
LRVFGFLLFDRSAPAAGGGEWKESE